MTLSDGNPKGMGATDETKRERRASQLALARWQGARRNGEIPALSDLGMAPDHESSLHYFVLKEDLDPSMSVFIQCGAGASGLLQGNPVRFTLRDAAPAQIKDSLCEACESAIRQGTPVEFAGSYLLRVGDEIRYRGIFMPVRSDRSAELGYVFGALSSTRFSGDVPSAA